RQISRLSASPLRLFWALKHRQLRPEQRSECGAHSGATVLGGPEEILRADFLLVDGLLIEADFLLGDSLLIEGLGAPFGVALQGERLIAMIERKAQVDVCGHRLLSRGADVQHTRERILTVEPQRIEFDRTDERIARRHRAIEGGIDDSQIVMREVKTV